MRTIRSALLTMAAALFVLLLAPAEAQRDTDRFVDAAKVLELFTTDDCTGTPVGTGTAADLGGAGIPISVADNTSTTLYADMTIPSGTSGCSTGLTYQESTPPPPPPDTTPPPTTSTPKKCKKGKRLHRGKCVKKKRKRKKRK